jgi:hypothetical protein
VLLVFSVVCIGLLSTLKKNKKLDPYVTLLGLLGTGSTGLHLQEKSIECAGAAFDKTNSFILEVMAECSKSPAVCWPSTRS